MPDFTRGPWRDVLMTIGQITLVIVVALVALRLARVFVHGIVKALMEREATEGTAQELSAIEVKKRIDTIETLGVNVFRFLIVAIALLIVLDKLGENIGPAVAGLGIAGIAIGFGAQSLVKDYLNGALILIENQFSKGDVVRIAGVSGTVEDFSLRRTTLRDLDGTVHTVPNGEIGVASNLTRVWARVNQDVTVAYGTDIDKAIEVVEHVDRSLRAMARLVGRRVPERDRARGGRGEPVGRRPERGAPRELLHGVAAADAGAQLPGGAGSATAAPTEDELAQGTE